MNANQWQSGDHSWYLAWRDGADHHCGCNRAHSIGVDETSVVLQEKRPFRDFIANVRFRDAIESALALSQKPLSWLFGPRIISLRALATSFLLSLFLTLLLGFVVLLIVQRSFEEAFSVITAAIPHIEENYLDDNDGIIAKFETSWLTPYVLCLAFEFIYIAKSRLIIRWLLREIAPAQSLATHLVVSGSLLIDAFTTIMIFIFLTPLLFLSVPVLGSKVAIDLDFHHTFIKNCDALTDKCSMHYTENGAISDVYGLIFDQVLDDVENDVHNPINITGIELGVVTPKLSIVNETRYQQFLFFDSFLLITALSTTIWSLISVLALVFMKIIYSLDFTQKALSYVYFSAYGAVKHISSSKIRSTRTILNSVLATSFTLAVVLTLLIFHNPKG